MRRRPSVFSKRATLSWWRASSNRKSGLTRTPTRTAVKSLSKRPTSPSSKRLKKRNNRLTRKARKGFPFFCCLMKNTIYNIIVTEFDPGIPKVKRLSKTTSLDNAIVLADKIKERFRDLLVQLDQCIVVVSYDYSNNKLHETLHYIA